MRSCYLSKRSASTSGAVTRSCTLIEANRKEVFTNLEQELGHHDPKLYVYLRLKRLLGALYRLAY